MTFQPAGSLETKKKRPLLPQAFGGGGRAKRKNVLKAEKTFWTF